MLFSKLIVLTGLLVSSIIASPVAAEDRADFPRRVRSLHKPSRRR